MAPGRFFSIPVGFERAIAELPDGDPTGRRNRAIARLLEAGLRPQEIIELDIDDPGLAASSRPSSVRVVGRKARVVHLNDVGTAAFAALLEDRRAGHRNVASSDITAAVRDVSATIGTKLRAHDFRRIAAIRIAEATTDEARLGLEDPGAEGST